MKRKRLLDSFAMLAYLNKEKGFEVVREAMSGAQKSGDSVLMNEINVGEVYYILFRKRGPEKADYFIETILASLPILTVPNSFEDVVNAAKIKAKNPLSFADCFAVDTARKNNAVILTGDPEFKKVEQLVQIEWLDK
ncbi:MAG: type II toxin-antitoxin system VapC family toxin [Deltaproteobacteria bacterium]|nr:type II toxin-antitoxin system VapC family toxin [Deltaproteobacteria bacterium]